MSFFEHSGVDVIFFEQCLPIEISQYNLHEYINIFKIELIEATMYTPDGNSSSLLMIFLMNSKKIRVSFSYEYKDGLINLISGPQVNSDILLLVPSIFS